MLLAVSDVVWQAAIAGFVTLVLAYMSQRTKAAVDVAASDAAKKVKDVKNTLDTVTAERDEHAEKQDKKLEDIAKVGTAVHALVNSAMGAQLKIGALALRRVADDHKGNPDDQAAADVAEKALKDHIAGQAIIDAKSGNP